jgi:hypothetical protein
MQVIDTLSYPIISCHTLSHPILFYPVIFYPTLSNTILSCHILPLEGHCAALHDMRYTDPRDNPMSASTWQIGPPSEGCGFVHAVIPRPVHLHVAHVHALLAQPPLHLTHVLPIHAELVVDRLH